MTHTIRLLNFATVLQNGNNDCFETNVPFQMTFVRLFWQKNSQICSKNDYLSVAIFWEFAELAWDLRLHMSVTFDPIKIWTH